VKFMMVHVDTLPNGQAIKAELRRAHARYEAKRTGDISALPMELAEEFSTHCYSWTGGTCRIFDCAATRNSTCVHHWGQGFFCVCPDGSCAGADGTCHTGDYQKLAHNVEIKNVKWPDQTLYFPTGMLETSMGVDQNADGNNRDDKFDVYMLPGQIIANGAPQVEFLVTTTGQPDYVAVAIDQGHWINHVKVIKLDRGWNDIQMASTIICNSAAGDGTYQFGSFAGWLSQELQSGTTVHWWYISQASVLGYVQEWVYGEPGPQGHWTFDPPLDPNGLATNLKQCI